MTDQTIHDHFMKEALKQARIALQKGEVPIGAVVVYKGQVISRGYNQTEMLKDPTAHAEMIAMTQASSVLSENKTDHRGSLEGVTVYSTLEPCPMCAGAMVLNKCHSVVYAAKDPKAGACESIFRITQDDRLNHRLEVTNNVMEMEARVLLQDFFKGLRKDRR